tara:strand:- start:134 stop:694 length:561 start_codon:yes stop_codon:yes gene_type:complete
MIFIKNTLVSKEILEKKFVCDLNSCKGACCVKGQSGAPLEKEEILEIQNAFQKIKKRLRTKSIKQIKKDGLYIVLKNGEIETPLNNGKECAYAVKRNGQIKCVFEESFNSGEIKFKKPISCHLYPVRIEKNNIFEKLNYEEWSICKKACELGERLKIPVYVFLKEALIRKYGEEWYQELLSKKTLY